jgi:hypothetical protein
MLPIQTTLFDHLLDLGGDFLLLTLRLAGGFALAIRLSLLLTLAAGPFRRVFQFDLATLA